MIEEPDHSQAEAYARQQELAERLQDHAERIEELERALADLLRAALRAGERNEVEAWAAWHPEKGFGQTPHACWDIDDAISDAQCATILDDSSLWTVVKVKIARTGE